MSRQNNNAVVELQGTIVAETQKAMLFEVIIEEASYKKQEWFPLSQISKIINTKEIGQDKITVPCWIADKRDIPYED